MLLCQNAPIRQKLSIGSAKLAQPMANVESLVARLNLHSFDSALSLLANMCVSAGHHGLD